MNKFKGLKKVKIPIIQRDYVQGRKNDEKAEEVIENFLEDLFNNVANNNNFHLDFIYGYYENDYFIPIDGQQRLTTLFLLHWYFAKKEGKTFENRLTYETRTSSREFTEFILDLDIEFDKTISEQIQNNKNFNPYWKYDPTIQSMLNVIDKIKEKDNNNITFNMLDNITFKVFEMSDFGEIQAEELYRKMNSRGKTLTPFENFKSIFEKIAFSFSKEKYIEIATNFEKDWINHFFDKDKIKTVDDAKKIDDYIMNFIYYITEMRYYETETITNKDNKVPNFKSFIFLETFYEKQNNFNFLVNVFNNLEKIKELSKKVEEEFIFFDTDKQANLFNEIINNKMTDDVKEVNLVHKTLFYLIILSLNEEYILDLLRIARNVLHRERAFKTGKIIYAQTIQTKDIIELLPQFKELINEKNPYENLQNINNKKFIHEKEKSKFLKKYKKELFELEDYRYIKGDLRLLLDICDIENLYKFIIQDKIFEDENLNITLRALLAVGDYSIRIGNIKRGNKYFFGDKGYMEVLLTENTRTKENKEIYEEFFKKLQNFTANEIIEQKLTEYKNLNKDWIYYFIKYPVILSNEYNLTNVFGRMKWELDEKNNWICNNTFVEKLETFTKITNKHINIYLLALLNELKEKIYFDKLEFDEDYGYTINYNGFIKIYSNYIEYKNEKYNIFDDKDFIHEIIKSATLEQ